MFIEPKHLRRFRSPVRGAMCLAPNGAKEIWVEVCIYKHVTPTGVKSCRVEHLTWFSETAPTIQARLRFRICGLRKTNRFPENSKAASPLRSAAALQTSFRG